MEILFQSAGPGVHCYSPFAKSSAPDSTPLNLKELCKSVILKCITIRRLSTAVVQLPLPRRLLQYITELSTFDFEKIECAPFSDAFSLNFFHRALTYRVMCLRDGQQYIMTYGYSPVEVLKLRPDHNEWIKIQHKNVMCICATVTDPFTKNTFYVYDQPCVSLEQMWNVFCEKNKPVSDTFFWRLTADVCEALQYILTNKLHYGRFGIDNIFVIHDRLVLENGLTRKSTKYVTATFKEEYINDHVVLYDIICILKQLLKNYNSRFSHGETLRMLLSHVEKEHSLESVIQIVNNSMEKLRPFSFVELIKSLKK